MKLRSKGKKVISRLLGQRKESSGQLADRESDRPTSAPPNIVVEEEESQATETRLNAARVQNTRNDVSNADAQNATTSVLRSDIPNIVGSGCEAPNPEARGFFNNAHHLVLTNPTMVDTYTNIVNQVVGDREAKAIKLLSKHIIPGAAHDSSARDPPPQCHPGTRVKINERIISWFYDERKRELIVWIYGPAGVGKSAIVQTIAEALATAKCLGASVFFSRPNGRNKSRSVIITIAYQLAVHIKSYCAFISEKLASDPELVHKGMKEQFRAFIVEPFMQGKIGVGGKTWGILLDGLDELDEQHWQREIIHLVTGFVLEHPDLPLVWVISSRPEPHISNTFKQKRIISSYREEYVPVHSPEACRDVEHYLRSSFETIRQDFPHIVPQDWPDEMKFVKLAHAASGLFAFADVAVRFIKDPKQADPVTRLDDVLSVIDGSRVSSADDQPFSHLDAIYTHILTSIPSKMWPTTQQVLGVISLLNYELPSAKGLSVILRLELSKIYASVNHLYSVLDVPLDDVYRLFEFHHASFVDFLGDITRSKEFYIPSEDMEGDLNEHAIRIWLDFKRQSPHGPSSEYMDRWSKYASQFHPDANIPVDVSDVFNDSLFCYVHDRSLSLMRERCDAVHKKASQRHLDQFLDLICQVDAAVACHGWRCQIYFVNIWFGIWKIYQKELTSRGIACEIWLEQLPLDHLEWPKEYPTHSWERSPRSIPFSDSDSDKAKPFSPESFNEYISGLKYLQQRNPKLQVLIYGTPGNRNRFAMFKYKYTEDDFKERPAHTGGMEKYLGLDKYEYHGWYCIPYPDNV